MRIFLLSIALLTASFTIARGQEKPGEPAPPRETFFTPDSARTDSMPTIMKRRLLPSNLSLIERGLWEENGLVRSTGLFPPLTPEERKSELKLRRGMLTTHQLGGFLTLGLMTATVYFGQRSIDHRDSRSLRDDHQTFVTMSIISYTATGLLAILAPPPSIRRDETSTTTIHKALAWVHVMGMILTPFLAPENRRTGVDQRARFHQISGYITTATFAASMIVVTF